MHSHHSLPAAFGPSSTLAVMRGEFGETPLLSQVARYRLSTLLAGAVRDPIKAQRIRAGLATNLQSRLQVPLLNNHAVVRQMVNAVVRGEMVLAVMGAGTIPAKGSQEYKHGDQIGAPATFSKGSKKWSRAWPVTADARPGDLASAPSSFKINAAGTKLTPVTPGPAVTAELMTTLNELMAEVKTAENEQVTTEKLIKEDEKNLAAAEKERAAAKRKLDEATTDEEKNEAENELQNAESKIELHNSTIAARKKHIEEQKAQVTELHAQAARGVENVRLHEQAHLDVTAFTAERANDLLKNEADPVKRQLIIDAAHDIAEATDQEQDDLLNPVTFGSEEDDQKLAAWISESSSQNYRATIRGKFKAKFP